MRTANAVFQVRISKTLKQQTTEALEAMGLTISDAVRLLCVRVAEEQALPFEIRVPTKATLKACADAKAGKTIGSYKTNKDLFAALNK